MKTLFHFPDVLHCHDWIHHLIRVDAIPTIRVSCLLQICIVLFASAPPQMPPASVQVDGRASPGPTEHVISSRYKSFRYRTVQCASLSHGVWKETTRVVNIPSMSRRCFFLPDALCRVCRQSTTDSTSLKDTRGERDLPPVELCRVLCTQEGWNAEQLLTHFNFEPKYDAWSGVWRSRFPSSVGFGCFHRKCTLSVAWDTDSGLLDESRVCLCVAIDDRKKESWDQCRPQKRRTSSPHHRWLRHPNSHSMLFYISTLKKYIYTLPFKSLGSLRNVFIFQRKALFFQ